MNDENKQILTMLAEGKISVTDAERLLDAVDASKDVQTSVEQPAKAKPKYLCVVVEGEDNINIRVPLQLLYAGMQFTSLIPQQAKEKIESELERKGLNFDLSNMKPDAIDEIISAFGDLEINVDDKDGEHVRIFCK
ncbi:hypothetical protein LLG46_02585 [bacterium]|nr:hypothetical protein [bacterium]